MNLIIQYGLLGLVLGLGFILYCRIRRPWHYRTCAHSRCVRRVRWACRLLLFLCLRVKLFGYFTLRVACLIADTPQCVEQLRLDVCSVNSTPGSLVVYFIPSLDLKEYLRDLHINLYYLILY